MRVNGPSFYLAAGRERHSHGSLLLHRQAAKALLRPWNESGLGRADRPAQPATDSVPAGRANRQGGVDAQCRRLSLSVDYLEARPGMRSSRCPFGRLLGRNWFKCYRYL
jgi:hypothetical protein